MNKLLQVGGWNRRNTLKTKARLPKVRKLQKSLQLKDNSHYGSFGTFTRFLPESVCVSLRTLVRRHKLQSSPDSVSCSLRPITVSGKTRSIRGEDRAFLSVATVSS